MRVVGIPKRGIKMAEAKIELKDEPKRSIEYPVPALLVVFFSKKRWLAKVNSIPPIIPERVITKSKKPWTNNSEGEVFEK
jgi:hypothetical protein